MDHNARTRASLCAATDDHSEVAALVAWLRTARASLTYISPNHGCGCCVHLFDVEGPEEVISTVPRPLRASSDWVTGGVRAGSGMGPPLEALLGEDDGEP